MKHGDWICPTCNDLVFASKSMCTGCLTPNPNPGENTASFKTQMCRHFASGHCRNGAACAFSHTENAASLPKREPKRGDWICPGCSNTNFSKSPQCQTCATPRA